MKARSTQDQSDRYQTCKQTVGSGIPFLFLILLARKYEAALKDLVTNYQFENSRRYHAYKAKRTYHTNVTNGSES